MQKKNSKKKYLIIIVLVLILLVGLTGLVYWKVERIIQSVVDSAQKASSQNTPLSD